MARAPAVPERRVNPPPSETTFIWTGAMLQSLQQCAVRDDRERLEGFYRVIGRLSENPRNDLLFAFGINSEHLTEPRDIIQVRNHLGCTTVDEASAHLNGIFAQLRQLHGWTATYGRSWLTTLLKVTARRHTGRCSGDEDDEGGELDLGRNAPPLSTRDHPPPLLRDLTPRCRLPTDRERMRRLNEILVSLATKQQKVFVFCYGIDDDGNLLPRRMGQLVERFRFKNEAEATVYVARLWTELHSFGLPPEIDEKWLLGALGRIKTRSSGQPRHEEEAPRGTSASEQPAAAPIQQEQPAAEPDEAPLQPAPPPDAPSGSADGTPQGTDYVGQPEEEGTDVARHKKPVELTPKEHDTLAACRKATAGAKPPENLATWARERGFANQWTALRKLNLIERNFDGTYTVTDTPVTLKEHGGKGGASEGHPVHALDDAEVTQHDVLHEGHEFFTEHPDLLKRRELVLQASAHIAFARAMNWDFMLAPDGTVHVIALPKKK
ncbi:MAG: hypothetical protein V1907_01635 [Candidatus Kerfeldbacteria bacterium]